VNHRKLDCLAQAACVCRIEIRIALQDEESSLVFDTLLLGDYFFDQIFVGLAELPTLGREIYGTGITTTGGAMFITAAALARLGANAAWLAYFGSDYYSHYVRELAVQEGVDLSLAVDLDAPYRRVTTSLPLHGERAFITYVDPSAADERAYWLRIAQSADYRHLHLGGLAPADTVFPLADAARARGATMSMDCQDVPLLPTMRDWAQLLAAVDIFMPNAREAQIITGAATVEAAVQQLAGWTRILVVKDGARGAWITQDGQIWLAPGIAVDRVVDTTGAGDCFNAGFLYGWLVERLTPLRSAQYGNVCGGLSVTGVGGATNAPRLPELHRWLGTLAEPRLMSRVDR
jgi:sugar/nucleoside kinase (ribokinase family)